MHEILQRLVEGQTLSTEETKSFVSAIMDGRCSEPVMASFLTALKLRGETVDELVGAALALRERLAGPRVLDVGLLDTCGPGGDQLGTFNISTAAAIVVSACGVPVAKHGNRSVSSSSGSADVLAALGVGIEADHELVHHCVRTIGLGFYFAPHWHPAMKHAMPVRRQLRFRTIFNLVGPLSNPAGAEHQLLGVCGEKCAEKIAEALRRLGTKSSSVVAGSDGLDEVTLSGPTRAIRIHGRDLKSETWTPQDFGLPKSDVSAWKVASPQESADVIRSVLEGTKGPARDVVLANAAAALLTVDKATDLRQGVTLAQQAIDSGAALEQLERLKQMTHQQSATTSGDLKRSVGAPGVTP